MKNILGKIALEVPAIVLAVFLALAVNNCNEDMKRQAVAEQTMEAIYKEIQENKSTLENNLADNKIIMKKLQTAMDTLKSKSEIMGSDVELGYEQTFLGKAAWEMAQLTGATQEFSPQDVQQLSIIHDLQSLYLEQGDRFFAQITTAEFHRIIEEHPKAQIQASLTLLKLADEIGEKTLKKYDNFLKDYVAK